MKSSKHIINKVIVLSSLLFSIVFLSSNYSLAQSPETWPASGSWQAPAGVTSVTVECWGAGGAGGGNTTGADGAGGGGGGAYSYKVVAVTPLAWYTVTVGTGGTSVSNATGNSGGDTWFKDLTTVLAKGGLGGDAPSGGAPGAGGTGGQTASGIGTTKFSGGNGGLGINSNNGNGGGGGSSAGTATNGTNGADAVGTAGAGGIAPAGGGDGGAGGTKNGTASAGSIPGGGGGGTGETEPSGAGANGQVILTYSAPVNNAPVVSVPVAQSICEDGTYTLSTTTNIADGDNDTQEVTIAVTNGTLDLVDGSMTVSGDGTNSITITNDANATIANINAAFDGAVFTPTADGLANIDITSDDGIESHTNDFDINVNLVPTGVSVSSGGTFCDNTTLTASGGTGGTIYWQNTTSSGTSTATASASENVTASGTYYFRAENAGCWSTEGSATITINATPAAVTASGAGTFCDNTTVTASGGAGGTIYWQNTTSGGTSTATASASESVTASGTYYFRAENNGCWGTEGSVTVTINTTPTDVTVSGGGTVCDNTTLTTSGGVGGTMYWQNTTSGGTSTATPSSSQPISTDGTYYFRAENNGCWSNEGSATVTINITPIDDDIAGPATVLANTGDYVYSTTNIPGATYTWTKPGPWSIDNGQSTYSITVTSGNSGGDIGLTVTNGCGTGNSTKTISIGAPPKCPTGSSVTPDGIQTVCEDVSTSELTNTVSFNAGGSGAYTELYQWYYNTTNDNIIDGGTTKISGATSSTYTPLSTSAEVGNKWYFCVGYATDNTCAQTDATQSLASDIEQITVNPKPGTPDPITGSASVLPGTTNLIYFTSSTNATSYTWTIPATWPESGAIPGQGTSSITVTAGGDGDNGDITVTASNSCSPPPSSVTTLSVTCTAVAAPPTITLGANPTSCENTNADLTYSATTDNPDLFSIDYNSSAESQGFVDVTDVALTGSPIQMAVPNNVREGTYGATLIVKNSTSGLSSSSYTISVTVNGKPGNITGIASANANTSGYEYSIAPIASAISYTWSVPAGWSGGGSGLTNTITATSGNDGQNGNITVVVVYACGTSTAATIAVTSSEITNHTGMNCSNCHTFHGATGSALTNAAATSDLCMGCHNAGSIAKDLPFLLTDQANSTGNKNSHSWDATAINTAFDAVLPTIYNELAIRVIDGKISCSTCHDQHNGNAETNYLRINNTNDVICKDCHMPRDVGIYTDDPAKNKGSHPIDITLDTVGSRFGESPTLAAHNDVIICSTCHGVHDVNNTGTLTTDGNLLKFAVNDETLCTDCHTPMTHNTMTCVDCHDVHNTDKTNIYMIRSNISVTTPAPASAVINSSVVFANETGDSSFVDKIGINDGICEVCHTITNNHRNDGSEITHADASDKREENCTGCHPHDNNFSLSGGTCVGCHATTQDAGRGGTVQIVGTGGEFDPVLTSRHTPADPVVADCEACHYSTASHPTNAKKLKNVDLVDTEWGNSDTTLYCLQCHDGTSPISMPADGVGYTYNKSSLNGTSHDDDINSCSNCHNRHGSVNAKLLTQSTNYLVCNDCHKSGGAASTKIIDEANKATPGTSGTSHRWDVAANIGSYETNTPGNATMNARLDGGNIVCSTCHDPHDNTNSKFQVVDNSTNQMCKDCHSARNVSTFANLDSSGRGSHPVSVVFDAGDSRFNASPTLISDTETIQCTNCHGVHNTNSGGANGGLGDGYLLKASNDETLCKDCHAYGDHNSMTCKDCHQTHNSDKNNLYMIKSHITVTTPAPASASIDADVIFTSRGTDVGDPLAKSFADGDGTYDGICEVCHTDNSKTFHYNIAAGDHTHEVGKTCTNCHTHSTNFAKPNCHGCHTNDYPNNEWPLTDGTYTEGAHEKHADRYVCSTCHWEQGSGGANEGTHPSGTYDVIFDATGLAVNGGGNTPSWNSGTGTCDNIYCHSNTAGTYTTTPVWNSGSINTCTPCHQVDISSSESPGTAAHTKHVGTLYNYACSTCHNGLDNNSIGHADGTKDVVFDLTGLVKRDGTDTNNPSFNTGTKVCSNIYCHSNGRTADRGTEGVANWGFGDSPVSSIYPTTPAWDSGSITACADCHEGPSTMPSAANSYMILESDPSDIGQVTSSTQYPSTGAHLSTGAHKSPDQLIILTEGGTYGDALSHSWPQVQCFWCHNNDAGAASGVAKYQGTYATSRHVDGRTWFYPSWYGYGGHGEKTSGGQAPDYYLMDTEAEIIGLGNGYVWHAESADAERRGSMIPGLGYSWSGPTNEHCGNGKNCW